MLSGEIQRCSMQPTVKWLYMGFFYLMVYVKVRVLFFYFLWGPFFRNIRSSLSIFYLHRAPKTGAQGAPKYCLLLFSWAPGGFYNVTKSRGAGVLSLKEVLMTRVGKKSRHALEQVRGTLALCSMK